MPRKNKSSKNSRSNFNHLFCVKRKFRNEKEAHNAAEFQMLQDMNLELTVYKCNLCASWHLTRKVDEK